ncbi:MAG: hypothetical protein RJA70_512 [Pseudomonadota bacterium]|jgi:CheY-like chemotaxis protein
MPNVLIFESDLEFANLLKTELNNRSCVVSVVEDATVGLQQAASAPPDLILLCTELPRMNGFSVCNRLKRDPNLQDVPVIIMSANASEETFQQHRNLPKKRADAYVHKPLSFEELLPHIEALMPLDGSPRKPAPSESPATTRALEGSQNFGTGGASLDVTDDPGDVVLEDDIELDDFEDVDEELVDDLLDGEGRDDAGPTADAAPQSSTDSDDNMAEEMFDALMVDGPEGDVEQTSAEAGASNDPGFALDNDSLPTEFPEPAGGNDSLPAPHSDSGLRAPSPTSSAPPKRKSGLPPPLSAAPPPVHHGVSGNPGEAAQLRNELALTQDRLADLESTLASLRNADEKLHQDLDEARARLASGATGPKAKDILDLREALNNKDKELLELRDQLNRREKELVSAKDNSLDFERKNADLAERLVELDKQMHSAERAQHAATQDRDQAAKRADDFRRKVDKLTDEVAHAREELRTTAAERDNLTGELADSQSGLQALSSERDSLLAERDSLSQGLAAAQRDASEQVQKLKEEHVALLKRVDEAEAQVEQSQQQAAEALDKLDQERATVSSAADAITLALDKLREISQ